jgi:putative nucleotidyltransferase with HDIG domain
MFSKNCVEIPGALKKIGGIFLSHGFESFLVGGAVRDMIMNKKCHDYDIATNASPAEVSKIFRRVLPTGIAHGTVTICIFGMQVETTTFRTESGYSDGRHPDRVEFAATIEEDLSRRDFTMNAIAADLTTGKIIDPFCGRDDIGKKIIRTVGDARERFSEDGLRTVRAVRFACQMNFSIEEKTLCAMKRPEILEKTGSVSAERFRDEFCKILSAEKPSTGLKLLEETKIMEIFIPEFSACRNCVQGDSRGFHEFDVADHIFFAADGAPKENLAVRLAAFFHDIGKPESKSTEEICGEKIIHFHGHEKISAQIAEKIMHNLKFPGDITKRVVHLVECHMFHYENSWSDAAVRRFVIRAGRENLDDLFALRLADIYGMHNRPPAENSPAWKLLAEFKGRIQKVTEENHVLSLKDLKVNGNDLMNEGIPEGKILGAVLNELFETVTDSPAMNEREKLLLLARNIYEKKFRVME